MIKLISLALVFSVVSIHAQVKNNKRSQHKPNIVLIMADDMGYSDLGCYGSEINTPNLDRLAKEGVRFREFYNNGICAPTRASLLTGQYSHKAGMGFFDENLGLPAYQGYLNKESLTLGEVFRTAGYSTLISGKWHVGEDSLHLPLQRGFDKFFGILKGASNYFNTDSLPLWDGLYPVTLLKNNTRLHPKPDSYYMTNSIADHAIEFLTDQSKENKPFFLYMAFTAPHWPLQALPNDIAKYKGKFDEGWDVLRTKRVDRLRKEGLLLPNQTTSTKDSRIPDWNKLTFEEQQYWKRKMEVYAAMVDNLDQNIGRVLTKLKEMGVDQNTMIVFLSDNGSDSRSHNSDPSKRTVVLNSGPIGSSGSFEYIERNWAYLNNAPLWEYKTNTHEGGICTSFIAWFPQKIKGGRIIQGTGHLIDIAPTFYEAAGITYPKKYNNITPNPLTGKSLLPVLSGSENVVMRTEPLCWERAGARAVRDGKWKLVSNYPSNKWELYDLEVDKGETKNLASERLDIVERLNKAYIAWSMQNGVVEFSSFRN